MWVSSRWGKAFCSIYIVKIKVYLVHVYGCYVYFAEFIEAIVCKAQNTNKSLDLIMMWMHTCYDVLSFQLPDGDWMKK